MHTTNDKTYSIQHPGLSSFEARPSSDGYINFSMVAHLGRATYFGEIKLKFAEDGSPKIGLTDYRFETFSGKRVRGQANLQLEDLMDSAKDAALSWATRWKSEIQQTAI